MAHRPREERETERIRMTACGARSAMDAALKQIGAAFDEAAAINRFKIRVERYICLGPRHVAMQARYGARAELLRGLPLNAAIATTAHWWRAERKAFQLASALGRGNRLSLDVLRELHLMLRLMRRKHMQVEYGAIVALLSGADIIAEAAE